MIDFFSNFPNVPYTVDEFTKSVANIAVGEIVVHRKIDSSYVLWKKELLDGDTAISVSDNIYGTTKFYWTLYYINDIVNPYLDWYKSQTELESYSRKKYDDIYGLHHFERRLSENSIEIIDDVEFKIEKIKWETNAPQGLNIFPVTNYEYEKTKNDVRRVITVISPRFINQFADEFHLIVGAKYDNR